LRRALNAHHAQQLGPALQRRALIHGCVRHNSVRDLRADRCHRVERVHGALENDTDTAPTEAAQRLGVHGQDVLAGEANLTAGDARGRLEQARDGIGDGALAAARLAGQAQHLAFTDLERDAVDGADRATSGQVLHAQVAHLQQRLTWGYRRRAQRRFVVTGGGLS